MESNSEQKQNQKQNNYQIKNIPATHADNACNIPIREAPLWTMLHDWTHNKSKSKSKSKDKNKNKKQKQKQKWNKQENKCAQQTQHVQPKQRPQP